MPPLLVDTDIFCKLGVSGLLEAALKVFGVTMGDCARLPALPHMLRRGRLPKLYGQAACDTLAQVAEAMSSVPAASAAWLDQLIAVPRIDPGEAQLFASAAEHSLTLLTGDKRALVALAGLTELSEALSGRIVTLEAVLMALCVRGGDEGVRTALQPVMSADRMVQACFSAGNKSPREALESYFNHLKREVHPLVLWDSPK